MSGRIKGPRPLSLHFTNSEAIWGGATLAGKAGLDSGVWHPQLEAAVANLKEQLDGVSDAAFQKELEKQASVRKNKFLKGLNQYLAHAFEPPVTDAPITYEIGCVKLHDLGGEGAPILLVPSLINPHYILDLMPGRSLATFLRNQGYRPLLVNWGDPGDEEKYFGLDGYISERLIPIIEHVVQMAGKAIPLVGYCMGGTLSVAVAARTEGLISQLVLLAAPWDFNTDKPHPGRRNAPQMLRFLDKLVEGSTVGVDVLQTFFTSVDPTLNDRKFRAYADGKHEGEAVDFFAAMEMWANNGGPLAKKVGQECLSYWYEQNLTMKGEWLVAGLPVRPEDIDCPTFVVAPKGDRLVPQASAFAIAEKISSVTKHVPPSGHIGMVVGDRAKKGLWEPLVNWLEISRET
ncbi:alpha/beta fold hydrolase [Kordiimonas laminariae]|uniref:alpha/beta fold hydrolase n=1 Tax=Kordiimonas laminariae TaxID=2917717 RepID=UPI001FF5CFF0|nr:alpha/beta fold hydrolase [Kordiimonas laminariae]MCK0069169.1 alpha/beta fold hydrolase [Kordiimonas laminariae]